MVESELQLFLQQLLQEQPGRIILSAPRADCPYRKAEVVKQKTGWQLASYTQKQVFHDNITEEEALLTLDKMLRHAFTQLQAQGSMHMFSVRITKKEKILMHKKQAKQLEITPAENAHNRRKNYLLMEGEIIPPLVDMGVFTPDGRVVKAMYDKYKQINRFVEMIDDALREKQPEKLRVVDFGCGKSYLTFILYYYFTQIKNLPVEMVGLDLKEDVVAHCNKTAKKYGYDNLMFLHGDIADYVDENPVDMVVSLHACDTATDAALAQAVGWGAEMIFAVPCCQHELNGQIKSENYGILTRYGIVKERVAALMTDSLRGNLLTACGYKTQLLEFVDLAHTPKNILIRAVKANISNKKKQDVMCEANQLMSEFNLSPTLLTLLQQQNILPEQN